MKSNKIDHIHFIGIGGSGMSVLAEYALKSGIKVTGSDRNNSKIIEDLIFQGADIQIGLYKEVLEKTNPLVVHSTAIRSDHEELTFAKSLGHEVIHRSDLLYKFMHGYRTITVAGTHGKTTTSALLFHMLNEMGLSPHGVIGGRFSSNGIGGFVGTSDLFIAEVDESDGSFLNSDPTIAILTNAEADHLDYYGTEEKMYAAFKKYLSLCIKNEGINIIGWDLDSTRKISDECFDHRLTYGLGFGSEIRAFHVSPVENGIEFQLVIGTEQFKGFLPLLGSHNVKNALACLGVAHHLGLSIDNALSALYSFPGVKRRLEFYHKADDIIVIDDYAHNPGKMQACVKAVRDSYPNHDIKVFYQPHRYSRLETMYDQTVRCFNGATEVFVLPVYAAGEIPSRNWDMNQVSSDISENSSVKSCFIEMENLPYLELLEKIEVPTIFLTLGAGDITEVSKRFKELLVHGKEGAK